MSTSLCIHGHFYQPPREDPWLGCILAESSAAPMRHWNRRILRESYAPLAFARRMSSEGEIFELMNCYEWMSFNVGPTLLNWIRHSSPELVDRMRDGDAKSLDRWGHGNAIAQVYHHVIMPLASAEDRELETAWAIADFEDIFKRYPEGMWLSECAVDLPSLETLADFNIKFVILAPRQARAVVVDGEPVPVDEYSLEIGEPYTVRLPSGRSITALFYHGDLSRRIAFEGLLSDGETFWRRLVDEGGRLHESGENTLLALATDGETYGHHFTFGEMALAHVLAQGREGRDNMPLTNIPAFIAANPPRREVLIHEPSSWSCVHGVERWRSDCSCSNGEHAGWNQRWRGPLREALNVARNAVERHFANAGKALFTDPRKALLDYGRVLSAPGLAGEFAETWFVSKTAGPGSVGRDKAWKLLSMQESSLASFASCAWFFDEIARIEPENALTYALRAIELMQETGGPDVLADMMRALDKAESNKPEMGTGKDVLMNEVLPRRSDEATQCLLAALMLMNREQWPYEGHSTYYTWPRVSVEMIPESEWEENSPQPQELMGTAIIRNALESEGARYTWRFIPPSTGSITVSPSVPLAESSMTLLKEGGGTTTRKVSEFSEPMRDYLLCHMLQDNEGGIRQRMINLGDQMVSLICQWTAPPEEVLCPEFWTAATPYVILGCMLDSRVTTEQCRWLEPLLARHVSRASRIRAMRLIRSALLRKLSLGAAASASNGKRPVSADVEACPPMDMSALDQTLAGWAERVRLLLPDMDYWTVQNKVWTIGPARLPRFAAAIGFQAQG